MTLLSQAKGRKVVSIATAATVGKVADFVIDSSTARVAAVTLHKTTGDGKLLPWANIAAFGDDAVTVQTEAAIVASDDQVDDLADKSHSLHHKRVLSTDGRDMGEITDVEFDPTTGDVTKLMLKDGSIDGHNLIATGSYAAIVKS